MTDQELDRLLCGSAGATLILSGPEGPMRMYLDRRALESPVAWRAALRRTLGHTGYEPPHYTQQAHDTFVRVLFQFADAIERERVGVGRIGG